MHPQSLKNTLVPRSQLCYNERTCIFYQRKADAMQIKLLRDKKQLGPLCYIIEAALEYFISLMVTGAYLARITGSLGFSDSLTGILSSFVSLGCVFQLGAIRLFRSSRTVKRTIILSHLVNQALFACVYFIPAMPLASGVKTALFLVCFCGAYIISNLIAPPKASWLISLISDGERGVFTARKEIVSLLSGMTFTYIMGSLVDHLEASGQQRLSFILGGIVILALMVLHTLSLVPVDETPRAVAASQSSLKELLRNRQYMRILPVILIWHIANRAATPFYGAYEIKELGFSMTFISVLSIAYSLVRAACSPALGRLADKRSFSRMAALCFMIAAAGYLVNCFTVPENGKIFYTIHYCLYAISMAGINSAMSNLVYDCVQGAGRRNALAIATALGGVSGFVSTCLMSPVVALIQSKGNQLFGLHLYPAQFVSAVAFVITALLILYLYLVVIPAEKK